MKTPNQNRLALDIETVLLPSAAAILHQLPHQTRGKTKTTSFTLGELHNSANSATFQIVAPISHIEFDTRDSVTISVGCLFAVTSQVPDIYS